MEDRPDNLQEVMHEEFTKAFPGENLGDKAAEFEEKITIASNEIAEPSMITEEAPAIEEKAPEMPDTKMMKIRKGEQVWEIPEDAVLDVTSKRSKEPTEVKLNEYKNEYWGRSEIDRSIQQLRQYAPALQSLADLDKIMTDPGMQGFDRTLEVLALLAQKYPQFQNDVKAFGDTYQSYLEASDEQKQQYAISSRAAHLQREQQKIYEQQDLQNYAGTRLANFIQWTGMTTDEVNQLYTDLVHEGTIPEMKDRYTTDAAFEGLLEAVNSKKVDTVAGVLKELGEEKNEQLARELLALASASRLSKDDLLKKGEFLSGKSTKKLEKAKQKIETYKQEGMGESAPRAEPRNQPRKPISYEEFLKKEINRLL